MTTTTTLVHGMVKEGETLIVVARFEEALLEIDRSGRILNRRPFNVSGVEGVALGAGGTIYLVADHGGKNPGEIVTLAKGE